MARFSNHHFSRTIVSVVVAAIIVGAAYEFHRTKNSAAATPPLGMSISSNAGNVLSLKPAPAPQVSKATGIPSSTLITRTPDGNKINNPAQLLPAVDPNQPVPVKPISAATIPPGPAGAQVVSGTMMTDAATKVTAGDLTGARDMLNNALVSGKLSASDTDAVKKQLSEINQTLIFSPRQFPKDPLGGVYIVKSGERLASIGTAHQIPYELLLQLNRMSDARKLRSGQSLKIINGPFHAVITKSKFTMDIYLGSAGGTDSTYITSFPVGLGTDNSTPTGTWSIKNKVTHPTYFPPDGHAGPVLEPNDPKNPLGNYWMGLEGTAGQAIGQQSYGIHGTIDPSSIGKQSSMGCIRLKNEDVEVVYRLLIPGKSMVVVKD